MPLDINLFREEKGADLAKLRESQEARNKPQSEIDEIIKLDQDWRKIAFDVDALRKQQNNLSKEFGQKKKNNEDTTELAVQIQKTKDDLKDKEEAVEKARQDLDAKLRLVGNLVHESVPRSNNEDNNAVVRTHGDCKPTTKYHHHELLWMIDGYAPKQGADVAGHRGYFLKGCGVLLNQALINYGLSFLCKRQYTPLQPPYFMRKNVMAGTAQLEEYDETLYKVIGEEEMYLIATSEQPISAFHMDDTLTDEQLPLRYGGVSTCFRKEAGSHGRDAWGIFRIHQFEKIEQFCITSPENSWDMHEEMITIAEDFYKSLGLAYRVVSIVSGALNNAAAKKYDLEAWFPTLGTYRELVSASNCTDYQSRAMETRYGFNKAGQREKQYVHMLNATLCATERTICCLLENYQTEAGVIVPEVLRPFMGGMDFMPFVKEPPKNVTQEKQQKAKAKAETK